MKQLSDFIKNDFPIAGPYKGVESIKKDLITYSAILIKDEESNFIGILTPLDLVRNPHNLIIDCLSDKYSLNSKDNVDKALKIMHEEQADVLPVYQENQFQGLVFKKDLIDFVSDKKNSLEKKIEENVAEINNINRNLEYSKRILNAIFNSTKSVIYLISPDYKLIFFNKEAFDISRVIYKREIKLGVDIREYVAESEKESYFEFVGYIDNALNGNTFVSEREIKVNDKSSYWFQIEYFPVFEGDRIIGVAITYTDINERKKHELFIEKQNQLLREISWTQSHKTRQPVATILGIINLFDRSGLSEKNRELFEMLEITTQKLDVVIKETVRIANSLDNKLK